MSAALYLVRMAEMDGHLRAVHEHQLEMKAQREYTVLGETGKILEEHKVETVLSPQVEHKQVINWLKEVRMDGMRKSLEQKSRHSKYWKWSLRREMDTEMCHLWLRNGRLQAETEAFIIAMQDGVLYTRE